MDESLFINGEEYVAIPRAAAATGISSGYVERLAAGRWIDASRVHGVWFVSLDSLQEFLANAEQDVYLEVRARERRVRAAAVIAQLKAKQQLAPNSEWVVLGQTAVIVSCGLLVGALTLAAWQAELGWEDLQAGAINASVTVMDSIIASPVASTNGEASVVLLPERSPTITNYFPPVWSSLASWLADVL